MVQDELPQARVGQRPGRAAGVVAVLGARSQLHAGQVGHEREQRLLQGLPVERLDVLQGAPPRGGAG